MKEFQTWKEKESYINEIDSMTPDDILKDLKSLGYKGSTAIEDVFKCLPVNVCVEKITDTDFMAKGNSKMNAVNQHYGLFISSKPNLALAKMLLRLSMLDSVDYNKIYGIKKVKEEDGKEVVDEGDVINEERQIDDISTPPKTKKK